MSLLNRLNSKREELDRQQQEQEEQKRLEEQERLQKAKEEEQLRHEEEQRTAELHTQQLRDQIQEHKANKESIEQQLSTVQTLQQEIIENKETEAATAHLLQILEDPSHQEVFQAMGISTLQELIAHEELQEDQEIQAYHQAQQYQEERQEALARAYTDLQTLINTEATEQELIEQAHTYIQMLDKQTEALSEELPEVKQAREEQERAEQIAYLEEHFKYQQTYPYDASQANHLIYSTKNALHDPRIQAYSDELLTEHLQKLIRTTLDPREEMHAVQKDMQMLEKNKAVDLSEATNNFYNVYREAVHTLYDLIDSSPVLKEEMNNNDPEEVLLQGMGEYLSGNGETLQTLVAKEVQGLNESQDRTQFINQLQRISEKITVFVETIKNAQTNIPKDHNPLFERTWLSDTITRFQQQHNINGNELHTLTQTLQLSATSQDLLRKNQGTTKQLPQIFEHTYGEKYQELQKLQDQAPTILQLARVEQQQNQLQQDHRNELEQQKASDLFEPRRRDLEIAIHSCKASTNLHLRQETIITLTKEKGWGSQPFTLDHPKLQHLQTLYRAHNTTKNELSAKENTIQNLQRQLAGLSLFKVIEKARLQRTLEEEQAFLQKLQNTAEEQQTVIQQLEQETKEIQTLKNTLLPIVEQLELIPRILQTGPLTKPSKQTMQLGDFLQYAEEAVQRKTVEHPEIVTAHEKLTKQAEELRTQLAK